MKLKGKVAIVTGGGRGLGRASAIEMAKEGASVVICSRTPSDLKETVYRIKAFGGVGSFLKADAADSADIKQVLDRTLWEFGRVDILMNNAAMIQPLKPIWKIEEEEWDQIFRINLKGAFLFSKAVIPSMIKQGGGKIIHVISGLGIKVLPVFGAYSVSKAGLIHLTRIMAEELKGANIQVNGLDPGVMDTRMQEEIRDWGPERLGDENYRRFSGFKEKGELKSPEKVAQLAVFLASRASDSITGENGTEDDYRKLGYLPTTSRA